jgi:hypothetical protein
MNWTCRKTLSSGHLSSSRVSALQRAAFSEGNPLDTCPVTCPVRLLDRQPPSLEGVLSSCPEGGRPDAGRNHVNDNTTTLFERRTCCDCDQVFTISAQELEWFERKGLNPPRRCTRCRAERRRERETDGAQQFHGGARNAGSLGDTRPVRVNGAQSTPSFSVPPGAKG